jgi:ankyrin repeat protein
VSLHGADVNQRDENGTTPLTSAARNGLVDSMLCLVTELELDVDINHSEDDGTTLPST